jgi:tetratricopeptide (TPR) repeat protein
MARRTLRASARDVLLTVALVLASARGAHAGDVEAARKIFAEGVKLYQQGDYEGARRLFKQADAEHHAPAIVYNLALAEEKLRHPQAAVDAYEAYVAEVGDQGELTSAATVAIAQLKARSTKLRIETKPSGARVFVDGAPLADPAPVTVLVFAGTHVVVAQGEGWRGEQDVQVEGKGDALAVTIAQSAPEAPPKIDPPPASTSTPPPSGDRPPTPPPAPPKHGEPDDLVWGASFAIVPAYLFGVDTREREPQDLPSIKNARDASSIFAGPLLEIGIALSPDFIFLARGLAGIGPDAKPSYAYMGGPGISFRPISRLWLGATFLGGRFETRAFNADYGTDLVFGSMLEVTYAVIRKPHGEWIAGFQPAFLLTRRSHDNTTLFFPMTFGYRAY